VTGEELALRGELLWGDDFDARAIEAWYEDEREGYASLYSERVRKYEYNALNWHHGFRFLPEVRRKLRVLCLGGAYGDELLPIIDSVEFADVVEPGTVFAHESLQGVPLRYVQPRRDGLLPFGAGTFDLITCFGTLHHIPNVSTVVRECYRCLATGGYAIFREPVIAMGDWRRPRPGLTRRERGLPLRIFRTILVGAGFRVIHESRCVFPFTTRVIARLLRRPVFDSAVAVWLDAITSSAFAWNQVYWRRRVVEKIGPTAACFVVARDASRT
jgi:SAM-dependent methyltransferase